MRFVWMRTLNEKHTLIIFTRWANNLLTQSRFLVFIKMRTHFTWTLCEYLSLSLSRQLILAISKSNVLFPILHKNICNYHWVFFHTKNGNFLSFTVYICWITASGNSFRFSLMSFFRVHHLNDNMHKNPEQTITISTFKVICVQEYNCHRQEKKNLFFSSPLSILWINFWLIPYGILCIFKMANEKWR